MGCEAGVAVGGTRNHRDFFKPAEPNEAVIDIA
jgi:hypothetical protein